MVGSTRRIAVVAFVAALVFGVAGVQPARVAAADLTISAAESLMARTLNADRAKAGLIAVRVDSRLTAIARARSADMAAKHYFSHTQPDGRTVFDILSAKGIKWYSAGEIIAWNTWGLLSESVTVANTGWLNSPTHRSIIMATSYNYMGVGLAIDASGKKLWTAVFMKGPDRTGGWVTINPVAQPAAVSIASETAAASYRTVSVSWRGGDVRLVVLTAGFRDYQVQRRVDGGLWTWVTTWTTSTSRSINVYTGHTYNVRVRACDKAGNCGRWALVTLYG
jgi:Cysteine-rich secretory protein family